MNNDNGGMRVAQRAADPWEALADASLDGDRGAARGAWRRIRARWLLPLDAVLLALDAERELSAAARAQLSEMSADGAR